MEIHSIPIKWKVQLTLEEEEADLVVEAMKDYLNGVIIDTSDKPKLKEIIRSVEACKEGRAKPKPIGL